MNGWEGTGNASVRETRVVAILSSRSSGSQAPCTPLVAVTAPKKGGALGAAGYGQAGWLAPPQGRQALTAR
jgi:hypothetical protein